jgi:pimeloyl-ACP methyl ester carboxylesterase
MRINGSDRPVVLIHGWPLNGDAWENRPPHHSAGGANAFAKAVIDVDNA